MRFIAALILWIVIIIVGGAVFVWSGVYNIGADVPHWPVTVQVINALRDHSIAQRDGDVTVPNLDDPNLISEGAHRYANMCTGCHLAPGMADSEMRQGLYPEPPPLAKIGIDNPAEAFWIIKHGIKMTAMPAWGVTHDDQKIWSMVAFVRKLPKLSVTQYQQMTASGGGQDHAPGNDHANDHGATQRTEGTNEHGVAPSSGSTTPASVNPPSH
ncbi:MAG: cytochrome c [Rhodanobacteraceae bacterium]